MSKAVIETRGLRKSFTIGDIETEILKGIDFKVESGEFVAIMGPSGSGKSTLMNILGFLDVLTEGEYYFLGQETSKFSDEERSKVRAESIGFVFQSFNLLPNETVLENVILPMIYSELSASDRVERAKSVLDSVGLAHRFDFRANRISGGERQRVAIARALSNDPDVIFADEPTGNLDSKSGAKILDIFADLNKVGKTIIMVTHEDEAAKYAERIIRMKDGIIESSSKNKIRKRDYSK